MFSFTFNGRSSKEFGITVGLRPNQISADRKVERVHIEGTNGELIEDLGANTYTVSFPIYIEDKENIDSIKSWLMGKGKFTRTDRPGQEITVYFYQLINFERIVEDLYQAMLTYTVTGAHWEKKDDVFVKPVEVIEEVTGPDLIPENARHFESPPWVKNAEVSVTPAPKEVFEEGYNRSYLLNSGEEVDLEEQDVIPTTIEEYLPTDIRRNLLPSGTEFWEQGNLDEITGLPSDSDYHVRSTFIPVSDWYVRVSSAEGDDVTFTLAQYRSDFTCIETRWGYQSSINATIHYEAAYVRIAWRRTSLFNKITPEDVKSAKIKLEQDSSYVSATPYTPAPEDFNNLKGKRYYLSQPLRNENILSLSGSFEEDDFIGVWLGNDKFVGFLDENKELAFILNENYDDEFVVVKTLSKKGVIERAKLEKGDIATAWTPAWEDLPLEDKPVSFIETSGGNHGMKYVYNVPNTLDIGKVDVRVKVKNISEKRMRVVLQQANSISGTITNTLQTNETRDVMEIFDTTNSTGSLQLQFRSETNSAGDNISFYAYQPAVYGVEEKVIGREITNEGNVYSRPIIRLERQSQLKGDITINNVRFLYEFKDGDTYLEIDGETQAITDEVGANRNRSVHIGYDFPILLPGTNFIKVNSGDAIIKVRRKDRWK